MRFDKAHNIADLRTIARRKLPAPVFHYIDGGADDEWTLRRNTTAFDAYEFRPRCLVDVASIDTRASVFGADIEWPFFCSPTALSRLFHGGYSVFNLALDIFLTGIECVTFALLGFIQFTP